MLETELIPWAQHETGYERMALAGCSFGGYHAVNTSFRHPHLASYCFSMSGAFDIREFINGYYDDSVYFNNPVDFIVNDNNPNLWKMGIVLGTSEHDICKPENERLSGILHLKNINHWLDVRPNATHDWPVWREMFPHYLSLMHDAVIREIPLTVDIDGWSMRYLVPNPHLKSITPSTVIPSTQKK